MKTISFALVLALAALPVLSDAAASGAAAPGPSAASAAPATVPAPEPSQWGNLRLGTYVTATVWGADKKAADRELEFVNDESERLEQLMTARRADGLVSRLNTQGGCLKAPAELQDVIQKSLDVARSTQGAFDPTIAPVVELWKADRPEHRVPERAEILAAIGLVGWDRVRIADGAVCLGKGQSLDLGGIAKGWICANIAESLKKRGVAHAILDFGGNVSVIGRSPKNRPWRIGIQDPDKPRGAFYAVVEAEDCSVVTSGGYERNFESGGIRYHHIIDPKTGSPSRADIASVSIVSKDGALADGLCTALFVMGWDKSIAWLKQHPDLKVILLREKSRQIYTTPAIAGKVTIASGHE